MVLCEIFLELYKDGEKRNLASGPIYARIFVDAYEFLDKIIMQSSYVKCSKHIDFCEIFLEFSEGQRKGKLGPRSYLDPIFVDAFNF